MKAIPIGTAFRENGHDAKVAIGDLFSVGGIVMYVVSQESSLYRLSYIIANNGKEGRLSPLYMDEFLNFGYKSDVLFNNFYQKL